MDSLIVDLSLEAVADADDRPVERLVDAHGIEARACVHVAQGGPHRAYHSGSYDLTFSDRAAVPYQFYAGIAQCF